MDKKGFNAEKIIKFIKKNKLYFGIAIIAVALLTAAFFAGGSLSNENITPYGNPNSVISSYDEVTADTNSTVTDSTENTIATDNTNSNSSATSATLNQSSSVSQSSSGSDASDITSQSSQTDNTSKNTQTSSNISPYSKEYYQSSTASSDIKASSSNTQSSVTNSSTESKDKYNTDPVPADKPQPVEPQNQEIEDNKLTCTISISCATILDNLDKFNPEKIELVPEDGWILEPVKVTFNEGESVYDLLVRVCKENNIHMSAKWTPLNNSHYIESINNIKEFDCPTDRFHNASGWMYCVNDWYPNYGISRYELKKGDVVELNYTCVGLGADLGAEYSTGG